MPFLIQVISGAGTPEKTASNLAGVPSVTIVLLIGRMKLGGWASCTSGWLPVSDSLSPEKVEQKQGRGNFKQRDKIKLK